MRRKGLPSLCEGFAIILVLAVLVLLAMLSITYIKLALIDRNIARNYMDNKRAKLIAQSGVEYAIARLHQIAQSDSFFFSEGWLNLQTKVIKINGVNTNYIESAGSTYGENRDIFAVTVKDCTSMINVNDGLGNERVTANTKRILNVLGGAVSIATLGDKIIDNRPPPGYTSKRELLRWLTINEFNTIKDFVTTHSWQDSNVANPVPLSASVLTAYDPVRYNTDIKITETVSPMSIYRYGKGRNISGNLLTGNLLFAPEFATADSFANAIYALDELNPQWIEIVSRSPVNINTASVAVLFALVLDLQGSFINNKRRIAPIGTQVSLHPSCASSGHMFSIYSLKRNNYANYGPASQTNQLCAFSELGYLHSTEKFSSFLRVFQVVLNIQKCRAKLPPYNSLPFGGTFKTFRQFNAFCDYLVKKGIIKDERANLFLEYGSTASDYNTLYPSTLAQKIAHQAKADVLKANFNPNLHLNELNPDANIATLVDKTDLIVNSTEFCFTPMGYFEIESEGFILKPEDLDNNVIANSKAEATVKLYDAYRETNQKQFLSGSIPNAVEIDPEPALFADVSGNIIAKENEWDGYISLPTLNATDWTTSPVTLYAHYDENFDAKLLTSGTVVTSDNKYMQPDRSEPSNGIKGPYLYNQVLTDGEKSRMCKSFRMGKSASLKPYAPADLRTDGIYIERHASVNYKTTTTETPIYNQGFVSYWLKPSFDPEVTGKPRTFFTISRYIEAQGKIVNFSHFLAANQINTEFGPIEYNKSSYRPVSFLFGISAGDSSIVSGGYGLNTPSLNHQDHDHNPPIPDHLKRGQWVHVTLRWDLTGDETTFLANPPAMDAAIDIFVNGAPLGDTQRVLAHPNRNTDRTLFLYNWVRIGEIASSPLGNPDVGLAKTLAEYELYKGLDYSKNWTCDMTMDELIITSGTDSQYALSTWRNGRYFKPDPLVQYQASFTSGQISLISSKDSPLESTISNPLLETGQTTTITPPYRILGISWTWFAEGIEEDTASAFYGKPFLNDYRTFTAPVKIYPQVQTRLINNGSAYGPYTEDGFSAINLETDLLDKRYEVIFNMPGIDIDNSVLLYTPIFDDITIYYTQGTQFVSYHCE